MNNYPILNIEAFYESLGEDQFYANIFSQHLEKHHKSITQPHKHDFYLLVFFTQGHGIHEIDFNTYTIKPGSLFFMRPGQTHHWVFDSRPEGYIFFHSLEFFEFQQSRVPLHDYPMYASTQNPPFLEIKDKHLRKNIPAQLAHIYEEYQSDRALKGTRLRNLIELVYIDIARQIWNEAQSHTVSHFRNTPRIRQLETLIDQHYLQCKKASEYAEMLHISTKHLNKIVHHALGKSTTTLIHERIVLEAKRLLVRREQNVQEVAQTLGFEDPAYFSRFFQKNTGFRPSAFAENYNWER
ncbi:helix-turn-helix domain-containing protein [Marinilongibacter aquaticus]|uniref:helix-turn-helix domain-containing protein n=1 Tax=Marinilongibacter aquaticus TaxID=2975157 RepID=UPI0021BDAB90|nr:helix-turn-helix domain-containing protein [Marinilongibacter aquaticus]UBM59200.1 helix-turn-helix domain-containing protein [Marinilongibacter aquaticus]